MNKYRIRFAAQINAFNTMMKPIRIKMDRKLMDEMRKIFGKNKDIE